VRLRSVSRTTARRDRSARWRSTPGMRRDPGVGRPCERWGCGVVRWPRRTRREVYRVFDDEDFLGDGDVDAPQFADVPPVADAPRELAGGGRRRIGAASSGTAVRSFRPLAPALLLLAVIAAGAIAVDAVSTRMQRRPRSTEGSRPARSPVAPDRARASSNRTPRTRVRRRARRRVVTRRIRRGHLPQSVPSHSVVQPLPALPQPEAAQAEPSRGEFSFEGQVQP
jgi:hypothetical protein